MSYACPDCGLPRGECHHEQLPEETEEPSRPDLADGEAHRHGPRKKAPPQVLVTRARHITSNGAAPPEAALTLTIPRASLGILAGHRESGKTTVSRAWVKAMAAAEHRILIVDFDDHEPDVRWSGLPEGVFLLTRREFPDGMALDTPAGVAALDHEMKHGNYDFVLLETLSDMVSEKFEENDARSMRRLVAGLKKLRDDRHATIVLTHHLKTSGKEGDIHNLRGSKVLESAAQFVYELWGQKDDVRRLHVTKWKVRAKRPPSLRIGYKDGEAVELPPLPTPAERKESDIIAEAHDAGADGVTFADLFGKHEAYPKAWLYEALDRLEAGAKLVVDVEAHNRHRYFCACRRHGSPWPPRDAHDPEVTGRVHQAGAQGLTASEYLKDNKIPKNRLYDILRRQEKDKLITSRTESRGRRYFCGCGQHGEPWPPDKEITEEDVAHLRRSLASSDDENETLM